MTCQADSTPFTSQQELRLYKIEKLCSATAIDALFPTAGHGNGDTPVEINKAIAYPIRAVWRVDSRRAKPSCPRFLIMVPKRRLRHAVDRVKMRRRCREAYRLNHHVLPFDIPVDIAFVYVASSLHPYADVERSMRRLLAKITESIK